jgi:membrane protein YqaA with SNARE-associated domain
MIWLIGAALWGAAEATFFFIVPDVLLTAAVLRVGLRRALPLAFLAAATAAISGFGMWWWGSHDAAAARDAMLMVPAVGPDLLARAHEEMAGAWPLHLFVGAVTGLPYKLYAVEAGALGLNPILFVLVSFVARLPRFLLTMALAWLADNGLHKIGKAQWRFAVWAASWIALYAIYFVLRGV